LEDKIRQASRGRLIFVAPTNKGNAHEITYPARYEASVLPMFATDGNVKKSALNPSQGPGKYNLAILGEDIKNVNDVVNSGTSYATAIAAGFAARLLDFSRHGDTKDALKDKAGKMRDKRGTTGVLLSLATQTFEPPFHCIRPWDLLPIELRSQIPFPLSSPPREEAKKKARGEICQMIMFGIDGRWGPL
jgi:hypothetical protein